MAAELKAIAVDAGQVSLEIWAEGEALGHVKLDGNGLEAAINMLASAREATAPPVASELAAGTQMTSPVDPKWRVRGSPAPGTRALILRHPGLGWVSFVLPEAECAALAEALTIPLEQLPAAGRVQRH